MAIAKASPINGMRTCARSVSLEQVLGDRPYFGGNTVTLADITASPSVLTCKHLDISLHPYPTLKAWCERLMQRPAWQTTEPSEAAIAAFKQAQNS